MIEVELQIPAGTSSAAMVGIVEQVCSGHNLTCTLKGTLETYPNSTHWHFKQGKQRGTLEITWWESENRLWFKVAKGRMGKWIDELLPELKRQIEASK